MLNPVTCTLTAVYTFIIQKWTPLHLAARNGHTGITKALINAKAKVDAIDKKVSEHFFKHMMEL